MRWVDMAFEIHKSDQTRSSTPFYTWKLPGGLHSFHRAHLLDVLSAYVLQSSNTNNVVTTQVHFNSEFASYSQSGNGVTLHLTNGKSMNFDLLVGSDGLWSPVRAQMYTDLRDRGLLNTTAQSQSQSSSSDSSTSEFEKIGAEVNPVPQWTGTVVFRALISPSALHNLNPQHAALKAPQMVSSHLNFPRDGTLIII